VMATPSTLHWRNDQLPILAGTPSKDDHLLRPSRTPISIQDGNRLAGVCTRNSWRHSICCWQETSSRRFMMSHRLFFTSKVRKSSVQVAPGSSHGELKHNRSPLRYDKVHWQISFHSDCCTLWIPRDQSPACEGQHIAFVKQLQCHDDDGLHSNSIAQCFFWI
jgi:hypothetical protein